MWASGYHMWCNFGAHMRNEGSNPATILFATSAQIISNNPKVNKSQRKSKKQTLSFKTIFLLLLKAAWKKGVVAQWLELVSDLMSLGAHTENTGLNADNCI